MSNGWVVFAYVVVYGFMIGYSVFLTERFDDGYRFDNLMRMEIAMADKVQKLKTHSVVTTEPDLTLRTFNFRLESQDRTMAEIGGWDAGDRMLDK